MCPVLLNLIIVFYLFLILYISYKINKNSFCLVTLKWYFPEFWLHFVFIFTFIYILVINCIWISSQTLADSNTKSLEEFKNHRGRGFSRHIALLLRLVSRKRPHIYFQLLGWCHLIRPYSTIQALGTYLVRSPSPSLFI